MSDTYIPIFNADGQSAYIDYRVPTGQTDGRQVIAVGDPDVNNNVAAVKTSDPGSTDQSTPGLVFRLAGSAAVQIVGSSGTLGMYLSQTGGTIVIKLDRDQSTLTGILSSIAVHHLSTGGTLVVKLDPDTSSLTGIKSSVSVHLLSTAGTIQVKLDPSSKISGIDSTIGINHITPSGASMGDSNHRAERVLIAGSHASASLTINGSLTGITNSIAVHVGSTGGTIRVNLDPDTSSITGIKSSIAVHLGSTGGTIGVKIASGDTVFVNAAHTASIFTVSGSASGVSASGNTIISPSANYNFKIFAFSIQTTGLVSLTTKFTNGSGGSPTELFRPLVTAASTSSSPVGANLAVTPPGYLFATGTNTTLSLVLDSATLVHYSVSYIKESA